MSTSTFDHARRLVLEHGWNATAYQILNPGIEHWLADDGEAVIGYVTCGDRWIVAGAPICAEHELSARIDAFEQAGRWRGKTVCYFGAAARLRTLFEGSPDHSTIAIGAQPVWNPAHWHRRVAGHASLHRQLLRASNKQVRVEQWPAERARLSPALRECLAQWLTTRRFPAMHFMVEPNLLDNLVDDRRVYVAVRDGIALAFLVASPVASRNGYLIEQIVRGRSSPNGTTELLIDACMRSLAADGVEYATQGLVALSRHARQAMRGNPLWVRALLAWARSHGRRFYNFEGLEQFRAKMQPDEWETIYAIANERPFSPLTLHAVARAFCNGSPVLAATKALSRAVGQEVRWLVQRRSG